MSEKLKAEKKLVELFHSRTEKERVFNQERINWLASYPKSGNTWLRLFLAGYLRGGDVSLNAAMGQTFIGDQHPYFYQTVSPRPLEILTPDQILALRPAALLHISCFFNSPEFPLLCKTHAILDAHNYLIPHFLTRKAVYIIRDPRDVCVSLAKHNGQTIEKTIERMGKNQELIRDADIPVVIPMGTWSSHVESWIAQDRPIERMVIRYEHMLVDPIGTFGDVVKFLGISYDKDILEKTVENTRIEKLRKAEAITGFLEKKNGDTFFNRGIAGGWKDVLTRDQVAKIEADHGQTMRRLGYATEASISEIPIFGAGGGNHSPNSARKVNRGGNGRAGENAKILGM